MKRNPAVNKEAEAELRKARLRKKDGPELPFMRSGQTGQWKEVMSESMALRFQKWEEEYLRNTDYPLILDVWVVFVMIRARISRHSKWIFSALTHLAISAIFGKWNKNIELNSYASRFLYLVGFSLARGFLSYFISSVGVCPIVSTCYHSGGSGTTGISYWLLSREWRGYQHSIEIWEVLHGPISRISFGMAFVTSEMLTNSPLGTTSSLIMWPDLENYWKLCATRSILYSQFCTSCLFFSRSPPAHLK